MVKIDVPTPMTVKQDALTSAIFFQDDYGGQRPHFVGFILEVPQRCLTPLQFLPNLQLGQNRTDSGTIKSKLTNPSH